LRYFIYFIILWDHKQSPIETREPGQIGDSLNPTEFTQAFLTEIAQFDFLFTLINCTDEFTFSGPLPEPKDLIELNGFAAIFKGAFSDWRFNPRVHHAQDHVVHISFQPTGTHSGDKDLSRMGMGIFKPTGKSFSLPQTTGRITFDGNKICKLHIDITMKESLSSILSQLGFDYS